MQISYEVPNWTEGCYQDKASVILCARPWKMVHQKKSAKAVLLCHGFCGYPGELIRPGMDLFDAGFDVFCPRYSGHGTSGADFLSTTRKDWLGTAQNAYNDISEQYKSVYLCGHSMGGPVAILIASRNPVERMALIAPALDIKVIPVGKLRFGRFFLPKRIKTEWVHDGSYHFYYEGTSQDDQLLGNEYWSYRYPRQSWQLHLLADEAKKALPQVKADTLALSGGRDLSVAESSSILVAHKPLGKNEHLHLPDASHLMCYDKDLNSQNKAMGAIVEWMTKQ